MLTYFLPIVAFFITVSAFAEDADYPGVITDNASVLPPLMITEAPDLYLLPGSEIYYFVFDGTPIFYYRSIWWIQLNGNWYVSKDYNESWVYAMDESVPGQLVYLGTHFWDEFGYRRTYPLDMVKGK
jgi:hypothetical protein